MVDLGTSLGVGIVATFAPLFVGLVLPKAIASTRRQTVTLWMVAIAAGMVFWLFIDVMGDAAQLDINQGFESGLGNYTHAILALMFAVGLGLFFLVEKRFSKSRGTIAEARQPGSPNGVLASGFTFTIAAVAALGIGFHAFGEGVAIGSTIPNAPFILDAIGGTLPGVAYVLHKGLEGFVIGVFALLALATSASRIAILSALSGIPTVIGFFIGIPHIVDSSYFFAIGGAGAVYVEFKLIPLLSRDGRLYASILPFLLGLYAMYFAGLFHS